MPGWPESRSHSAPLAAGGGGGGACSSPKPFPARLWSHAGAVAEQPARPSSPEVPLAGRGGRCRSLRPSRGVPGGSRVPCAASPGGIGRDPEPAEPPPPSPSLFHPLFKLITSGCSTPHGLVRGAAGWGRAPQNPWARGAPVPSTQLSPASTPLPAPRPWEEAT